jgi:hypothetical protein
MTIRIAKKIEVPYEHVQLRNHDQMFNDQVKRAKRALVDTLLDELDSNGFIKHTQTNNPRRGCYEITFSIELDTSQQGVVYSNPYLYFPEDSPVKKEIVYKEKPVTPVSVKDVADYLKGVSHEKVIY